MQASLGDLHEPEQLEPGVDVRRTTLSAIYHRHGDASEWQTTFAFGRNDPDDGEATDAYLLESTLILRRRDIWFGRVERVEEHDLFDAGPLAGSIFTVHKLSLGYLRELAEFAGVSVALGALGSLYDFDDDLEAAYGEHPRSFMVFLRAAF